MTTCDNPGTPTILTLTAPIAGTPPSVMTDTPTISMTGISTMSMVTTSMST